METSTIIFIAIAMLIALCLIKYLFVGAASLFVWATEQGFIGFVVYFACWIVAFPLMLLGSIIAGAVVCWSD